MFLLCTFVQPQGIEPKTFICSVLFFLEGEDVLPLH